VRHRQWVVVAVLLMVSASACGDSPTGPTPSSSNAIAVSFALVNPGTLSLSDPVPCAGDKNLDGCPHGLQAQGLVTTSAIRTERYTLQPGTYLITGRAQGTSSGSPASVRIAFARAGTDGVSAGVDNTWGATIFIGITGPEPPVPPLVHAAACVTTIANSVGGVEWGVVFRVVATSEPQRVCP
jgi:hypothetical protein